MTASANGQPPTLDRVLPYYRWFVLDHRSQRRAQRLSVAAEGALRRLLDEQWLEGCIPPEPHKMAEVCGCSSAEMRELWPALEPFFQPDEDGHLINRRLEGERTKLDAGRVQRIKAGRLGGIAKAKAQMELLAPAEQPPADAKQPSYSSSSSRAEQSGGNVASAKQPPEPDAPKRLPPPPPTSPLLPQAALTSNGTTTAQPATTTAPPPSPFEEEPIELPLAVSTFLHTFYGRAKPERLADVEKQLRATLTPAGCAFEAGHVRAVHGAHLTACAIEVCKRVLINPDVAVTILLKRVRETYLEQHSAAMKQLERVP